MSVINLNVSVLQTWSHIRRHGQTIIKEETRREGREGGLSPYRIAHTPHPFSLLIKVTCVRDEEPYSPFYQFPTDEGFRE